MVWLQVEVAWEVAPHHHVRPGSPHRTAVCTCRRRLHKHQSSRRFRNISKMHRLAISQYVQTAIVKVWISEHSFLQAVMVSKAHQSGQKILVYRPVRC